MLSPKGEAKASIEVKKSKFIARALMIKTADEAHKILMQTRAEYPDATHVVHAFRVGAGGDIFGMSDDREPHCTAGRPVLEVIKGSGITNILLMVVRYFGGTKLGTGGLVKAYTKAAKSVITVLPVEELVEKKSFSLRIPYGLYDSVKKILKKHQVIIHNEKFETDVQLEGVLPEKEFSFLQREIENLSQGTSHIKL